jgi:hypothetical protein
MKYGLLTVAILASMVLAPCAAHAQETLNIDFFQGPLVSSGRVVGMGGAFVSVAEGADAHLVNPASLAIRYPYAADDWFDWDYAISFRSDSFKDGSIDLDRSGRAGGYDRSLLFQLGVNVKLGRLGIGLHAQGQTYELDAEFIDKTRTYTYSQTVFGLGFGWAFLDGELSTGVFLPLVRSKVSEPETGEVVLEESDVIIGAVFAPHGSQFRFGGAFRAEAIGRITTGVDEGQAGFVDDPGKLGELRVPDGVVIPWELSAGFSWMFGPRDYNPHPSFGEWSYLGLGRPDRLRERKYLLLSSDIVLTGPSRDSVGVQAWLENEVQQSGKAASLSPRVGAESEIWKDVLVVRAGSYYEPSRFDETSGRVHATAGFDVFLLELFWGWKGNFVLDVADDYVNWGVGVGFWH